MIYFYKGEILLDNTAYATRIHFYSFMYICSTFIIYLFLAYSENFLGYVAVPLYLLSYIINITLILVTFIVSKLTPASFILSFLSSLWIVYGISSDIYFDGLNNKIMIPLIIVAIISIMLRYLNVLRNQTFNA